MSRWRRLEKLESRVLKNESWFVCMRIMEQMAEAEAKSDRENVPLLVIKLYENSRN